MLGVDISGEMAALAGELEERDPTGVRYEVDKVRALRPLGRRFDIATAVQPLDYAEDVAAGAARPAGRVRCRARGPPGRPGGRRVRRDEGAGAAGASVRRPWPAQTHGSGRAAPGWNLR
ncbi:class I SAM-dependent methyltransferase [Streptomyces sp. MK7]|uniref:class I SAM-dependent methyltransferase n=1 Tax=Streptomyces sp. MK7 TaxID=3067635 RepID=UPI00292E4935|nr:class I SAM-dependent methyltransferase [Streptomyces sp. MK7]